VKKVRPTPSAIETEAVVDACAERAELIEEALLMNLILSLPVKLRPDGQHSSAEVDGSA
jgi:hypothetical protein